MGSSVLDHMSRVTGAALAPNEMLLRGATPEYVQHAWVDVADLVALAGAITVKLCDVPANHFVSQVDVWVEEAFNSESADDSITVGYTAAVNALVTALEVLATGVKTAVIGAGAKVVVAAAKEVTIYYTYTAGAELDDPTTGKVLVTIHYTVAPAVPA